MAYRNDTKGARAIHFHTGNYVLVEPGATVTVDPARVRRVAPGLVEAEDIDGPGDAPEELAAQVRGQSKPKGKAAAPKPGADEPDERKALREEYAKVLGKKAFTGWSADQLREKIAAAKP